MNLKLLKEKLLQFRKDRDWEDYHDPKNLAIALSIEANELLEHFLWVSKNDVETFSDQKKTKISEEIADVFIYLFYISYGFDINLEQAVLRKIELNGEKYPLEKSKLGI